MRHLRNIFNLGIKELRSLLGDKAMLALIVFSFTVSVYSSATVTPGSLNLAPIAIADMDQSQLSNRIVNSFYRPWFLPPEMIQNHRRQRQSCRTRFATLAGVFNHHPTKGAVAINPRFTKEFCDIFIPSSAIKAQPELDAFFRETRHSLDYLFAPFNSDRK